METTFWQSFDQDEVLFVGISNTNNQNVIANFIIENGLTFPILFDSGSSGGVQGGDTYDLYYMPNDGSPYPRDFIIGQDGTIEYANNEIDTEWMLHILDELISNNETIEGDINADNSVNILDVVILVNFVLNLQIPNDFEFSSSDLNNDDMLNVLDIVHLVNIILY